jgi:hypothetical protein
MRIYIESTIPSYVVARPARDLLQAARQQLTRDWWDLQREKHELYTSQVVLDEIADGERAMAERRLELMAGLPLLISTSDIEALATAYGMDILLTWNCRHIANAAIVGRLRKLVAKQGYTLPEIYTPEELLGV